MKQLRQVETPHHTHRPYTLTRSVRFDPDEQTSAERMMRMHVEKKIDCIRVNTSHFRNLTAVYSNIFNRPERVSPHVLRSH